MLGQPIILLAPRVVGVRLSGALPKGTTATDLVLTVTQILRARGVVDKFVEFFGPGLDALTLADRATMANMAPEYGRDGRLLPIDAITLDYLRLTGRSAERVALVEAYAKEQGLFRTAATPDPVYSETVELDMGSVEASLADRSGRRTGQARRGGRKFVEALARRRGGARLRLAPESSMAAVAVATEAGEFQLRHGSVVIAAITSCTNTSNPSVMVAAGLVARKGPRPSGIFSRPWVKTSLAPGSRVVTDYLERAGSEASRRSASPRRLRFAPRASATADLFPERIDAAIKPGEPRRRVGPQRQPQLREPDPPVGQGELPRLAAARVAYALAGRIDIDFEKSPINVDAGGKPRVPARHLASEREVVDAVQVLAHAGHVPRAVPGPSSRATPRGGRSPSGGARRTNGNPSSTYIAPPVLRRHAPPRPRPARDQRGARARRAPRFPWTTDHISPAARSRGTGRRAGTDLAGRPPRRLQLVRGAPRQPQRDDARTFATCGSRTCSCRRRGERDRPPLDGETMSIYDAAMRYREEGTPLVVIAGAEYGTGSSRDWAAKGTVLLGVRAVIAKSFRADPPEAT